MGRMVYRDALAAQVRIHDRLRQAVDSSGGDRDRHPNTLILVEHPAVYTIGIRTGEYPKSEEDRLRALGADFERTNRGGLITFHGIGQLVAYPILHLPDFPVLNSSVRCYVHGIEDTVIRLCNNVFQAHVKSDSSFKPPAVATLDGYPGVWIDGSRKIAAIGVHAANMITMHGVALNCNMDLTWYDHIVPCGIQGKGVTSLTQELHQNFTIGQTIPYFLESFRESFKCELSQEQDFTLSDSSSNESLKGQA
jgi:lipoyl(octanoyl) transferase